VPNYRRVLAPGGCFFFTVVTHGRRPILTSGLARECLHTAWTAVRQRHPFTLDAIVVLPDHLHCVWSLPEGDADFSSRWRMLKGLFTREYLARGGESASPGASRQRKREATVWQRRFWEHAIRDVDDLRRHLDYIHFNPVKHGYVRRPLDWEWSTFRRQVERGWYDPEWGTVEPDHLGDVSAGE